MAAGATITPGYNPATFSLGCGFIKTNSAANFVATGGVAALA